MQSIPALTQLEHGSLLLHRTLRRRHVTQLRGLRLESGCGFVLLLLLLDEDGGFTPFVALLANPSGLLVLDMVDEKFSVYLGFSTFQSHHLDSSPLYIFSPAKQANISQKKTSEVVSSGGESAMRPRQA